MNIRIIKLGVTYKMKRLCGILLASTLVLGACGQDEDKSNKTDNKQSEHKSRMTLKRIKMKNQIVRKDSKDNSNEDKQQANSDSNDTSSNESQSTSKTIMVNHKTIMETMNEHKANKLKLHNKITNSKVTIIKLNKITITNKAITNKHKITTVMTQEQIDEWNRTKPTTHDESQMEQVPQTHSGGHPSAFGKSDVPVGTQKQTQTETLI